VVVKFDAPLDLVDDITGVSVHIQLPMKYIDAFASYLVSKTLKRNIFNTSMLCRNTLIFFGGGEWIALYDDGGRLAAVGPGI
jgi:hypothetical protein